MQLIWGFTAVTGLQLAAPFSDFISSLSFTSDLVIVFGCIGNVDFYQKLLLTTLMPIAVVTALAASWAWTLVRVQDVRRREGDGIANSLRSRALLRHWTAFLGA